ncbi:MAG: hypothetical protein IIU21_01685 [Schwartzia sp.]|nr:hypothetical protein [Schwartzia sp. (in: firmicutes)]
METKCTLSKKFWLLSCASIVLYVSCMILLSRYLQPNSDKANHMYEALDISRGNLFLKGWNIPETTFLTTDLPFYIIGIIFGGLSNTGWMIANGLMVSSICLIAFFAAFHGQEALLDKKQRSVKAVLAILLLAIPSFAYMHDLSIHIGALCYSFLCFLLADSYLRGKKKTPLIAAGILACLGAWGDMLFVLHGAIPLCIYCALHALRREEEDWKTYVTVLLYIVISVLAGRILNHFYYIIGNITKTRDFTGGHFLLPEKWVENFLGLIGGLFSYQHILIKEIPALFDIRHAVTFANLLLAMAGACLCCTTIIRFLRNREKDRLSSLLSIGIMILVCVYTTTSKTQIRYMNFIPVALHVLVLRNFSLFINDKLFRRHAAAALLFLCAFISFMAKVYRIAQDPVPEQPHILTPLNEHGLSSGYAQYWDASSNSVLSKDCIHVRHVIYDESKHHIIKWIYFNKNEWYTEPANFIVCHPEDVHGITKEHAIQTFGEPKSIVKDGIYEVLIYDYDLSKKLD